MALAKSFSEVDMGHQPSKLSWISNVTASLLITLAAFGLSIFVATSWAKSQLLDTNNWVEFVTPIPKEPEVSEALSKFVTTNILKEEQLTARVEESLPPEASFLAPTLARQIQDAAKTATGRVIESQAFASIWISVNQAAHQRLVNQSDNEPNLSNLNQRFDIDLQDVRPILANELGASAEALGASEVSTREPIQIGVDLKAKPKWISDLINRIEFFDAVLPYMVTALVIWGIYLASNRRMAVIGVASFTSVLLLLELILIKLQRNNLQNFINDDVYEAAALSVYDSLVASLGSSIIVWLGIAVFVWVAALLAGNGAYGLRLRDLLHTEEILKSQWYEEWRMLRIWLGEQKYYFWTIIVMIALFYLAFVININKQVAANTILSIIAGIGFVNLLATPPYLIQSSKKKRSLRNARGTLR